MTDSHEEKMYWAKHDARLDIEHACLNIARWAGPKFDQGLTLVDLEDPFGSSVLTELFWQAECA